MENTNQSNNYPVIIRIVDEASAFWRYWQREGKWDALRALAFSLMALGIGVVFYRVMPSQIFIYSLFLTAVCTAWQGLKILKPYFQVRMQLGDYDQLRVKYGTWLLASSIVWSISSVFLGSMSLINSEYQQITVGVIKSAVEAPMKSEMKAQPKAKKKVEAKIDMQIVPSTTSPSNVDLPTAKPERKTSQVNPYAPAKPSSLKATDVQSYINKFASVAIAEMKQFNIPASITLAQGIIESRCGTSKLAVKNNNHFGIKCFSKGCKEGHCTNHNDDNHKDFFLRYDGAWASFRDHSKFLSKPNYNICRTNGKDYRTWAIGLKKAGYATEENYATSLIQIIERNGLQKFDSL